MPPFEFGNPSACVVAAAEGYPEHPLTGRTITGIEAAGREATVFQAGTARRGNELVTSGGRVLATTASGETLAYQAMGKIHFQGMHFRRDIGSKGLQRW